MTWQQLDNWSDGGLSDYLGMYGVAELEDDWTLPVWECDALGGFVEVLEQIRADMPSNYDGEYMEYTSMINRLKAAI